MGFPAPSTDGVRRREVLPPSKDVCKKMIMGS